MLLTTAIYFTYSKHLYLFLMKLVFSRKYKKNFHLKKLLSKKIKTNLNLPSLCLNTPAMARKITNKTDPTFKFL